jgi:hypothetical protein
MSESKRKSKKRTREAEERALHEELLAKMRRDDDDAAESRHEETHRIENRYRRLTGHSGATLERAILAALTDGDPSKWDHLVENMLVNNIRFGHQFNDKTVREAVRGRLWTLGLAPGDIGDELCACCGTTKQAFATAKFTDTEGAHTLFIARNCLTRYGLLVNVINMKLSVNAARGRVREAGLAEAVAAVVADFELYRTLVVDDVLLRRHIGRRANLLPWSRSARDDNKYVN